jgi:hypothetical protein
MFASGKADCKKNPRAALPAAEPPNLAAVRPWFARGSGAAT